MVLSLGTWIDPTHGDLGNLCPGDPLDASKAIG